jgi:outer membrane protein
VLHPVLIALALQGSLAQASPAGAPRNAWEESTRVTLAPDEHRASGGDDSIQTVSLADAVRRSYRVAPNLVAADGLIGTTAWQKRAAILAVTTPAVGVGGDLYSVTPQAFNFNVLPPTASLSALSMLPLTSHITDANVTASYTLFNGGQNLSRIRAARFNQASAEANGDAVRADTRVAVESAYYTVAADQELLRVANERVQSLTEELALARARVNSGAAVQTDSLQLTLELTTARVSLLQQEATTQVDRLGLGRQTGVSTPVAAEPLDTLPPAELPFTVDRAVAQALETGPAYARAKAVERANGAALAVQEGSFLPTVTVSASRLAYGSQVLPSQLYRNQLAVSVSFPILDQGQREYGVAVAGASLDSARAVRADLDRGAQQDVTNAYDAYNTARATVLLQQTGVTVAQENLRVATLRYQSGLENILNLLTAQVSLTQAESDLVNARKSARLALASLQARLGKQLVPEEAQ